MDEALLKKLCRAINFLLSLYNVKRVCINEFQKTMVQFYYFCLYLGTEAAVSCRLMDGKDRHVLLSFF